MPVLWAFKVPIFEVPIMGTFTHYDEEAGGREGAFVGSDSKAMI